MNLIEIWEVAGPLVVIAIIVSITGLLLLTMGRKMELGGLRKLVRGIAWLSIVVPILFLLYTLVRATIFLFFL
jgi:hypothetical protein